MNRIDTLMFAFLALTTALSAAGCGARSASTAQPAAPPRATENAVDIPSDSPMLKQIQRAPTKVENLPTDEIVAAGEVEANPNHVAKVVLPVAGRVVSVMVKTGDRVSRDEPLLVIQSPDADAAMSTYLSAQAGVTQADAALTKAQADDERATDLFTHDAVAKKDVLAADSGLAQAKAGLEQAKAAKEQAQRRLSVLGLTPDGFDQRLILRSPLDGKVLELSVVPGEFRNDTSEAVMTIADLNTVWVTSQVPETYIRFVQIGEHVDITLPAYPGRTFEGRVSRISDTVDPQTRTVKVQAELDNHAGELRPEMSASIHHIESMADMVVVPVAAVLQSGGASIVFVETSPGHFERRAVTLGGRAGDAVRVTKGLKGGDAVVTDGAMLLQGLVRRS